MSKSSFRLLIFWFECAFVSSVSRPITPPNVVVPLVMSVMLRALHPLMRAVGGWVL